MADESDKEPLWPRNRNGSFIGTFPVWGRKNKYKTELLRQKHYYFCCFMLCLPGVVQNMKGWNGVGSKMMVKIQAEG